MRRGTTSVLLASVVSLTIGAGWFIFSGRCLKWAINHDSAGVLSMCLAIGAPIEADLGAYGNPLTHAVSTGHIEHIAILVRHGANPNQYAFRDMSLLAWGYSVAHGAEIGEELLRQGADVNAWAIPSSRKTILMFLLGYSELSAEKIRSVLAHKPDLTITDAEGNSTIDILLKRRNDLEIIGFSAEEIDLVAKTNKQTRSTEPNQALQRMNTLVTDRAPSSTLCAKRVHR
jgi:hypothetical protein